MPTSEPPPGVDTTVVPAGADSRRRRRQSRVRPGGSRLPRRDRPSPASLLGIESSLLTQPLARTRARRSPGASSIGSRCLIAGRTPNDVVERSGIGIGTNWTASRCSQPLRPLRASDQRAHRTTPTSKARRAQSRPSVRTTGLPRFQQALPAVDGPSEMCPTGRNPTMLHGVPDNRPSSQGRRIDVTSQGAARDQDPLATVVRCGGPLHAARAGSGGARGRRWVVVRDVPSPPWRRGRPRHGGGAARECGASLGYWKGGSTTQRVCRLITRGVGSWYKSTLRHKSS